MDCPICKHEKRAEIEMLILDNPQVISEISKMFKVDPEDLKAHGEYHMQSFSLQPYGTALDKSLVGDLGLREAGILEATCHEYLVTLKTLGRKINKYLASGDDYNTARLLTKSTVDLYLGLGEEIRQNIRALNELNNSKNTIVAGGFEFKLGGAEEWSK